jgi:hypothetical protein
MELNERLLADIRAIFKKVQYGDITFYVNPEKKTLNYSIKHTGQLAIDELQNKPGIVLDRT